MNRGPASATPTEEFQRETWEDDGGAGLTGPRTASRVPIKASASPNAGRVSSDRTSRPASLGIQQTTP